MVTSERSRFHWIPWPFSGDDMEGVHHPDGHGALVKQ